VNRALAALIGLVFVLANLAGFVHEATAMHVRCAEHGEMVHGETGRMIDAAAHATLAADPGASENRGHDHCGLASLIRQSRCAPNAPVLVPAPVTITAHATAPDRVATVRDVSVYRIAPKTSPPA
jgi:hypothetical protein